VADETSKSAAPQKPVPGAGASTAEIMPARLIDFGKARPKRIRALKQGRGPLYQEVLDALTEARSTLEPEVAGKPILPLIVIVEKNSRRRTWLPLVG